MPRSGRLSDRARRRDIGSMMLATPAIRASDALSRRTRKPGRMALRWAPQPVTGEHDGLVNTAETGRHARRQHRVCRQPSHLRPPGSPRRSRRPTCSRRAPGTRGPDGDREHRDRPGPCGASHGETLGSDHHLPRRSPSGNPGSCVAAPARTAAPQADRAPAAAAGDPDGLGRSESRPSRLSLRASLSRSAAGP